MLEWLRQNLGIITALTSVATLVVWFVFAQLFYYGFRRQHHSRVLINKGVGSAGLDAPCLICNMSKEPIFIQAIFAELETDDGRYLISATDKDESDNDLAGDKQTPKTRQGPLDTGRCFEIRRFKDLIQKAADAGGIGVTRGQPDNGETFRSLTVTVISVYGPEDEPFGAARKFEFSYDAEMGPGLTPSTDDTVKMTSGRDKKRVKELLREAC